MSVPEDQPLSLADTPSFLDKVSVIDPSSEILARRLKENELQEERELRLLENPDSLLEVDDSGNVTRGDNDDLDGEDLVRRNLRKYDQIKKEKQALERRIGTEVWGLAADPLFQTIYQDQIEANKNLPLNQRLNTAHPFVLYNLLKNYRARRVEEDPDRDLLTPEDYPPRGRITIEIAIKATSHQSDRAFRDEVAEVNDRYRVSSEDQNNFANEFVTRLHEILADDQGSHNAVIDLLGDLRAEYPMMAELLDNNSMAFLEIFGDLTTDPREQARESQAISEEIERQSNKLPLMNRGYDPETLKKIELSVRRRFDQDRVIRALMLRRLKMAEDLYEQKSKGEFQVVRPNALSTRERERLGLTDLPRTLEGVEVVTDPREVRRIRETIMTPLMDQDLNLDSQFMILARNWYRNRLVGEQQFLHNDVVRFWETVLDESGHDFEIPDTGEPNFPPVARAYEMIYRLFATDQAYLGVVETIPNYNEDEANAEGKQLMLEVQNMLGQVGDPIEEAQDLYRCEQALRTYDPRWHALPSVEPPPPPIDINRPAQVSREQAERDLQLPQFLRGIDEITDRGELDTFRQSMTDQIRNIVSSDQYLQSHRGENNQAYFYNLWRGLVANMRPDSEGNYQQFALAIMLSQVLVRDPLYRQLVQEPYLEYRGEDNQHQVMQDIWGFLPVELRTGIEDRPLSPEQLEAELRKMGLSLDEAELGNENVIYRLQANERINRLEFVGNQLALDLYRCYTAFTEYIYQVGDIRRAIEDRLQRFVPDERVDPVPLDTISADQLTGNEARRLEHLEGIMQDFDQLGDTEREFLEQQARANLRLQNNLDQSEENVRSEMLNLYMRSRSRDKDTSEEANSLEEAVHLERQARSRIPSSSELSLAESSYDPDRGETLRERTRQLAEELAPVINWIVGSQVPILGPGNLEQELKGRYPEEKDIQRVIGQLERAGIISPVIKNGGFLQGSRAILIRGGDQNNG